MEITGRWKKPRNYVLRKRRSYSEIGAVLELFQDCYFGPSKAGPQLIGATWIGSSNWVELGPVTWAQSPIQSTPVIWACPVLVQSGPKSGPEGKLEWRQSLGHLQWLGAWPKCFWPEHRLLEALRIRCDLILSPTHNSNPIRIPYYVMIRIRLGIPIWGNLEQWPAT